LDGARGQSRQEKIKTEGWSLGTLKIQGKRVKDSLLANGTQEPVKKAKRKKGKKQGEETEG